MKKIFLLLITCTLVHLATAQQDTTLTYVNWKQHATGTNSWLFTMPVDTFDATSANDTLYVTIPHIFSTGFAGQLVARHTNVSGSSVGSIVVQSAPTSLGPWSTAATIAIAHNALEPTPVNFVVRNLMLRVLIVGDVGIGVPRGWLTLKPASIN